MATENWNSFPSLINRAKGYHNLQRRIIEYQIHEQVCRHFGLEIRDISDILSTETDGILPSAIHRVIVTNQEQGRYSFPCFTHPAKGKHLRRLLTNKNNPGAVYRNAFAEVYRPHDSHVSNRSILRILHPEILEYLGQDTLRIKYDHFLERRLADIGLFNDDHNLKARILGEFENRIPALTELEDWEMRR